MDIYRPREPGDERRRLKPSAFGLMVGIGVLTVSAWFQKLSEYPAENRREREQEQIQTPPDLDLSSIEDFLNATD